jgi:hypothetical protein
VHLAFVENLINAQSPALGKDQEFGVEKPGIGRQEAAT